MRENYCCLSITAQTPRPIRFEPLHGAIIGIFFGGVASPLGTCSGTREPTGTLNVFPQDAHCISHFNSLILMPILYHTKKTNGWTPGRPPGSRDKETRKRRISIRLRD